MWNFINYLRTRFVGQPLALRPTVSDNFAQSEEKSNKVELILLSHVTSLSPGSKPERHDNTFIPMQNPIFFQSLDIKIPPFFKGVNEGR